MHGPRAGLELLAALDARLAADLRRLPEGGWTDDLKKIRTIPVGLEGDVLSQPPPDHGTLGAQLPQRRQEPVLVMQFGADDRTIICHAG